MRNRELKYHIYIIRDYIWKDGSIGKIGVTENLERRAKQYKLESLEVLESHSNLKEVSKREIELQKFYKFKVDNKEYWKVRKMTQNPEVQKKRIANTDWEARTKNFDYKAKVAKMDYKAQSAKRMANTDWSKIDWAAKNAKIDWKASRAKIDWKEYVKKRDWSMNTMEQCHTPEVIAKRVANTDYKAIGLQISTPVNQYDLKGNFIQQFTSAHQAGLTLGKVNGSPIHQCCKGKQKTAYKFIWKYA
jgi:hypothetical protein